MGVSNVKNYWTENTEAKVLNFMNIAKNKFFSSTVHKPIYPHVIQTINKIIEKFSKISKEGRRQNGEPFRIMASRYQNVDVHIVIFGLNP